ncbi:hypothetical protein D3C81_2100050 [compost metagenome]
MILSLGVRADKAQVDMFKDALYEVYPIGDCATKGGTLWNATKTAFNVAMEI